MQSILEIFLNIVKLFYSNFTNPKGLKWTYDLSWMKLAKGPFRAPTICVPLIKIRILLYDYMFLHLD